MKPLNDDELRDLLEQWRVPPAPPSLRREFSVEKKPGRWRWLTAEIRVPAPVGALTLVALVVLAILAFRPAPRSPAPIELDIADFQPVKSLNPRIVRSDHAND